jgi:lipoprotein-anchoring transpeptidase ErfK/SrfK
MAHNHPKIHHHKQKALNFALEIFFFILVIGILAVILLDLSQAYKNKIFPRMTIAGVAVGGQTPDEAKITLQAYNQAVNKSEIELTYQNQSFTPQLQDLGVGVNLNQTIQNAFNYGRQGSLLMKIKENSKLAFEGYNTPIIINTDQKTLNDYTALLATKINVVAKDRQVSETTGKVIDEGSDGQILDQNKLASAIDQEIASGQTNFKIELAVNTINRNEVKIKDTFVPGQAYAGRYIEVDLTKQTLYAYDNNKLVKQFLISSGIAAHPTKLGTFYVYGKSRVTEMKGEGYDLPGVQWVSWYSGDYSIHGTYWHHNFGHPMSHGCLNASNTNALWIYNWDSIGTPVWIHL